MATPTEKKIAEQLEEALKRIEALENWKDQKTQQQITLPLDESSKRIINNI